MGVGESFFHMKEGDVGIIFPDLIHHYQVLSNDFCEAVYINAPGFIVGKFEEELKIKAPVCPVIKEHKLSDEELAEKFPDGYKELPAEVYQRLHIIPETFIVDEHHVHVYVSKKPANKKSRLN